MLAKIVTGAVPIVTVGLLLEYLGKETYGLWMTITSFFSLFVFADFGLGSGLLARLSRAYGRNDKEECARLTSSAFFLLLAIAALVFCTFIFSFRFIPWPALLNAETDATARLSGVLIAAVFLPQVIQLPFAMIQRTQLALQEGYWTNLWQCGASLFNLVLIVAISRLRLGQITLVFSVALVPAIAFVLNWFWYFFFVKKQLRPRWRNWSFSESRNLISIGGAYCVLAVLTTAGLSVDNLIVANVCGLSEVAQFSIVSRIASLLTMALGMICMPMWAANSEALARGDVAWVRNATHRAMVITTTLAFVGGVAMVLLGPWLFSVWLGESFEVTRLTLAGFAGRELVLSIAAPLFMVLNGAGRVLVQIRIFVVFTVVTTILKVLAADHFGSVAVPWAMVFGYVIFALPKVFRETYAILTPRVVCEK